MKKTFSKINKISILIFALVSILFITKESNAQVATANLGEFQLEWRDNAQFFGGGSYGGQNYTGQWPGGWFRSGTLGRVGIGETAKEIYRYKNMIDATSGLDTIKGGIEYAPEVDAPRRPLREIRRFAPPQIIVDGKPFRPYTREIDPNLPSAQIIKSVSKTGWGDRGGAWFKVSVYAFDNPNFNDFVILDFTMVEKLNFTKENEGPNGPTDQIVTEYFSPILDFAPSRYGVEQYGEGWPYYDTWNGVEVVESKLVPPGTTPRDSLVISYAVDGNDPRRDGNSNFADPIPGVGFVSPQYVGYSLLYADKSVTEKVDNPLQPVNATTYFIDDLWNNEGTLYADWATAPGRENIDIGPPWNIKSDVEDKEMSRISFQWVGPYNMALNDSIHFVVALGAGGINPVSALELGKNWMDGNVADAVKDSIIATGLDSLVTTLDKAKWAWNNFMTTGDFGIPFPLPAPDINVKSGPGFNTIKWSYPNANMFNNAKTGADDFAEWRVYQKRGDYLVNHPEDNGFQNYKLVFSTTNKSDTYYKDEDVIRGETYHYYVTAVNKAGLESSAFANRTLFAATPFEAGVKSSEKVKIVPNPYIINARKLNFSQSNDIKFFNLPPYATLRIYNELGDLVKVIDHQSGSGDEFWNQLTEANQYVASGVYILSVQDAKDLAGNSLPVNNYKFVIIR